MTDLTSPGSTLSDAVYRLLDSLEDGILLLDTDLNVLWTNQAMHHLLPDSQGAVIGANLRALCTALDPRPERDASWIDLLIGALQSQEEPDEIECARRIDRGAWQRCCCSVRQVSAGGSGEAWLIHFRDAPDQGAQDVLEGIDNYQAIFEYTGTATMLVEEDGTISRVNTEFERLSGYLREEIEGKRTFFEFVADPNDLIQMKWYHKLRRTNPGAAPREYHFRFVDRYGTFRLIRTTAGMIPGTSQSVLSFLDVTEQKRAEQALRVSEERLNLALTAANDGLVDWNVSTGQIIYSPRCFTMLGYEAGAFSPTLPAILDLVHPDDRNRFEAELSDLLAGKSNRSEMEFRMRDAAGDWVWILDRLQVVERDADYLPIRIVGTHTDITERKRTEEALRIKDKALASSIDGIIMTDLTGTIIYANDALLRMGGWKGPEELIGKSGLDFWQASPLLDAMLRDLFASGEWSGEFVGKRKDGSLYDVQASMTVVTDDEGGPICILASCNDISERKQQEQALRESEERFRLIVETAPSLLIITDASGKNVYVSPNCEEITGYTQKDLLEGRATWWVHEDDTPRVREAFEHAFSTGAGCRNFEYKAVKKNGEIWYVSSSWEPLRDADGRFLGFVMQKIDVTGRKQVEEDLLIKNKAIESSITAIAIADPDGCLRYTNPASLRMWGYASLDEVAGVPIARFWQDEAKVAQLVSLLRREGEWSGELVGRRKDGTTFDNEVAAQVVTDETGRTVCLMAVCTDITERKRVEEALRVSEERYRTLVELSPEPIAVHSDGKLVYVNPAGIALFSAQGREELIGKPILELVHPDDHDLVRERISRMQGDGKAAARIEERFLRLDGQTVNVEVIATPITYKNVPSVLVLFRDITERKRMQEALQFEHDQFLSLFDSIEQIAYVTDPYTHEILYVNPYFARALGKDVVGGMCYREFQGLDAPCPFCTNEIILKQKPDPYRWEYYNPIIDMHLDIVDRIIQWPDGRDVRFEIAIDITERKRAEEELRIKEKAIASSLSAIAIVDLEGRLTYVNQALLELNGLSNSREIVGRHIAELWPEFSDAADIMQSLAETGEWVGELTGRKVDGTPYTALVAANTVTDEAGNSICVMATAVDITGQKRMEEALRESEERYRTLAEGIHDAIYMLNTEGRVLYVNSAGTRMLQKTREDIVGKTVDQLFPPELAVGYIQSIRHIVASGESYIEESRISGPEYEFWVEARLFPLFGPDGSVQSIIGISRDVSERKKAEERLRFQSQVLSHVNDAVMAIDTEGSIIYMNRAAEELYGVTAAELIGRPNTEAFTYEWLRPEDEKEAWSTLLTVGTWRGVNIHRKRNGEAIFIEATVGLMKDEHGNTTGTLGVLRDITAQKRMEEALRSAEREKGLILDTTAEMFAYYDEDLTVLWVNRATAEVAGSTPEEIVGRKCYEVWHNRAGPCEGCPVMKARDTRKPQEKMISTPDGRTFFLRGYPVTNDEGELVGLIEFGQDITERERAERDLRIKDMALAASINAFAIADFEGRMTYTNRAFLDLWGYDDVGEVLGRSVLEFWQDEEEAAGIMRELFQTGESVGEMVARRRDGTLFITQLSGNLVTSADGSPICLMASFIDITEQKRAEAEIQNHNRELSILNKIVAISTTATDIEDMLESVLATVLDLLNLRGGGIYLMDPLRNDWLIARKGLPDSVPQTPCKEDLDAREYAEVLVKGNPIFHDDHPMIRYPEGDADSPCPTASIPIKAHGRVIGALNVVCGPGTTFAEEDRSLLVAIGKEVGSSVERAMLIRQLEAAQQEANLYLDILSHDIGNTENVAGMYTDLLIEMLEGEAKDYAQKLKTSIQKGSEILRNVSTIRRIHHESAALGPIDLDAVVRNEIANFPGIRFRYDGTSAVVMADPLLSDIFTNLIENAVKFGGPDVEVTIRVEEHDEGIFLSVQDDGPGIPDEMKGAIFKRFERGISRRSGKGLGLYITRMLVERYGGHIHVGDRVPGHPDQGAAFRITLKRAPN